MFKRKIKEPKMETKKQVSVIDCGVITEPQNQEPVTQAEPTKPSAAEHALIEMLSGLSVAGVGVPPVTPITIDCGEFDSAEPEPAVSPVDPSVSKVLAFLRLSPECTRREVAGGCELRLDEVNAILARLTESGAITSDSGYENTRRYKLAGFTPTPAQPVEEFTPSTEMVWSAEQRQRELAEERRLYPEPPIKRYEPTEEEIDAEMEKRTTIVLTDAQRKELDVAMRNRRPLNPQAFIVKR